MCGRERERWKRVGLDANSSHLERRWWTEDSSSALIQAHFPRTQLADSQLSPPEKREEISKKKKEPATETLRVPCCFSAAAYLNPDGRRLDAGLRKSTAIWRPALFAEKHSVPRLLRCYKTEAACQAGFLHISRSTTVMPWLKKPTGLNFYAHVLKECCNHKNRGKCC